VFLRGYLEGEAKILVDGTAVTASAYDDTKKILHGRYGDKNRIIQAHLDYLEEVTPIRFASAEALNTMYIELWKLLRVIAWILRFRQIALRTDGRSGNLTALELEAARSYWIQAVQGEYFAAEFQVLRENMPLPDGSKIARFNPLLDEGLIRLGGRLHFAKLSREQCHPLLLDGRHDFTKLLILQTHIRLHHLGVRIILAELREEFWILHAQQTIK